MLWDRSPIAHLDRLKAKVMLIVGGEDQRVPPMQGENLHNALDKAHIRTNGCISVPRATASTTKATAPSC